MKIKAIVAIIIGFAFISGTEAKAQFSKAVVVMKGVVKSEQTGKVHSVKVSVRAENNKSLEVTSSVSNSESGNYLVVLQPSTKYWVHLEGEDIITKDEMIQTPSAPRTTQMQKDFSVTLNSVAQMQKTAR